MQPSSHLTQLVHKNIGHYLGYLNWREVVVWCRLNNTLVKGIIPYLNQEALGALLIRAIGTYWRVGRDDVVMLLFHQGVDVRGVRGVGALYRAIECRRTDLVDLLFERGATDDVYYANLLDAAVRCGEKQIVERVLDHYANLMEEKSPISNALATAAGCSECGTEIMELLLVRGARISEASDGLDVVEWDDDDDGEDDVCVKADALGIAAYNNYESKVKLLLDRGAVNLGRAVRLAAIGGCARVVELLVNRGADINEEDGGGEDALDYAVTGGHLEVVDFLLSRGASVHKHKNASLRKRAARGHQKGVELLLDRGANIHACEDEALREAAAEGHTDVVNLLLDRGANIHARRDEALRRAAEVGDDDMVELLVERGADFEKVLKSARSMLRKARNVEKMLKGYEAGKKKARKGDVA